MGYPRIEKPYRFECVCLFSPLEHASSMAKYLKCKTLTLFISHILSISVKDGAFLSLFGAVG